MESCEDVPLEFCRLSIDSVKVSVALRSCDPFFPFPPSFLGLRMLMDLSKTQHRIRNDVDFRALKIDDGFVREDTEQNVRTRQSTQRRGRRTTRHHNAAQLSTARVGALRPMPYCLGIGSTRVGPGRTPTVHPC